ncbi:MAG: quinolinate synthase NadA [Planctomycetaceae bacterium]|nr:quinolinate synthase NadA [Planctomycetaceae bacterium]
MLRLSEIQKEILRIKNEKDVCILAHSYQTHDILEIADFTGDSYQLSVQAANTSQQTVIMCGVRFMAETVKILSPDKTVYLAHQAAGCPMAELLNRQALMEVKKQYPDYTVVCYINTAAELKTVCDVCVTSSSAVDIVRKIENKNILFIPDSNLGDFVAKQVPEKNIKTISGGCPIHFAVTADEVREARRQYPEGLVLVHPECVPEVVELADFIGSTSAIMEFAKKSDKREFIIGTEMSIAQHLQYQCPNKRFHCLSKKLLCPDMKLTTLIDVLNCLNGEGGEEIKLDAEVITAARGCIDKMLELG